MEIIKPLFAKPTEKKIASFDTEDDSKGRAFQFCFYNGYRFRLFNDREKFIEYLYDYPVHLNKYLYLYAHNLEYDLINVFKYHFGLIEYIRWNNFVISAKLKDKNIIFLDSVNLSHTSLKKLGDIIGLPKLDFDPTSEDYVKRDTEIVFEYVRRLQVTLLSEYKSNLKYTLPSISLEIFRRNFFNHEVKRVVEPEIFESYYGGRTEAFFVGRVEKNIQYCDVNSMYPFNMLKDYPDTNSLENCDSLDVKFGYAKATVKVDEPIPLLPVRVGKKVYFPAGEITGVWTVEELKKFRDHNPDGILNIEYIQGTDKGFPYFTDFIKHFYKKRNQNTDPFYRNFYKLIMNSLYGKFGERLEGNEFLSMDKLDNIKGKYTLEKVFGSQAIIKTGDINSSKNSNPLWASYVTAYSRVFLWENLIKVKDQAKLLYCDTDSIIYQGEPGILPESKNLGDWKTEQFKSIEIKGAKFYRMENDEGEVYRIKGVPVKYQDIFFDAGIVAFDLPMKFRETLKIDKLSEKQAQDLMNYWTKTVKESISKYDKREIFPDGSTAPRQYSDLFQDKLRFERPPVHTLRKDILNLGGLKPNKDLPKWFKRSYFYLLRKRGNPVDEMVSMLNNSGWNFSDIDDFLDKINLGWINFDCNGNSKNDPILLEFFN